MTMSADNILIVLPNWVGDAVLATPVLRALRKNFDGKHITYLLRPYLTELFGGCPWYDQIVYWPSRKKGFPRQTAFNLIKQLRQERFDVAVLLANSLRSALVASLAKITRRVGYDRDGRGMLLTDKLIADRYDGRLLPISAVKYYMGIADYLGCAVEDCHLELFTEPQFVQEVDSLFVRHGLDAQKAVAVINPGASFGSAKCWPAEYFAQVADAVVEKYGLNVVIPCGPREVAVAKKVVSYMKQPAVALTDPIIGLGTLKALIKRCAILITNDTGPRHFSAAFGVPVVTIFGSTDPRWTETLYPRERSARIEVDCGPCMKRTCPERHHKCMRDLSPQTVLTYVDQLLRDFDHAQVRTTDKMYPVSHGQSKPAQTDR